MGLCESRLELHDPLQVLDRRGRLAPGEMHSSSEEKSVEIRGALLEESVEHLEALVILLLRQGHLGEAAPGRQEPGSLLADLRQDSLTVFGLLNREVEVRQLEPCRRANGRELGRRSVLPLSLPDIPLGDIKVPQHRMRFQRLRLLHHCFLKGTLCLCCLRLSQVQGCEGYVEPGLVAVVGPCLFEALGCSVHLLRSDRRSSPKE